MVRVWSYDSAEPMVGGEPRDVWREEWRGEKVKTHWIGCTIHLVTLSLQNTTSSSAAHSSCVPPCGDITVFSVGPDTHGSNPSSRVHKTWQDHPGEAGYTATEVKELPIMSTFPCSWAFVPRRERERGGGGRALSARLLQQETGAVTNMTWCGKQATHSAMTPSGSNMSTLYLGLLCATGSKVSWVSRPPDWRWDSEKRHEANIKAAHSCQVWGWTQDT